jgi:hypothetical protein
MRYTAIVFSMLACTATSAATQIGISIGHPTVSIGINLPVYPELVRVPGYPVYYAPRVNSNVFFYDGLYWVYQEDTWYASTWYNGPWGVVSRDVVPVYVLRVPVRYYRQPPAYFSEWAVDAPPRWGDHWGSAWQQQRVGWDRWNRSSSPALAPLPLYQRQYSGDRYPRLEQQQVLQGQQDRYQPRDTVVRQYYQQQGVQVSVAPAAQQRQPTRSTRAVPSSQVNQWAGQSAQEFAPGQLRKQQGAQSAKDLAPGQVKKQQGAQSARQFAPGQARKQQAEQSAQVAAPRPQAIERRAQVTEQRAQPNGRGRGNRNRDEDGDGGGNDKGKGRGKD